MERRLHTRHRARTAVYVSVPGLPGKLCRARNLSANGVFIETENLGLKKGATVHLAFAINLGVVTKIHRRTAIVAHVSKGGNGLMMERLTRTRRKGLRPKPASRPPPAPVAYLSRRSSRPRTTQPHTAAPT